MQATGEQQTAVLAALAAEVYRVAGRTISRQTLVNIARGENCRLDIALGIVRATAGQVQFEDLAPLSPLERL